jgi:hypothetical protein
MLHLFDHVVHEINLAAMDLRGGHLGHSTLFAFLAIQFGPERMGASLGSDYPGAIDPRRIVPNVLVVTTLEFGNPVSLLVRVKSRDLSLHTLPAGEFPRVLRGAERWLSRDRFCATASDAISRRAGMHDLRFARFHIQLGAIALVGWRAPHTRPRSQLQGIESVQAARSFNPCAQGRSGVPSG